MSDSTDHSGKEGIDSIMSAIRRMVRKETRAHVDAAVPAAPAADDTPDRPDTIADQTPPPPPDQTPPPLPRRILVLQPHMRVDRGRAGRRQENRRQSPPPQEPPEILDESAKIPHAPPTGLEDSFAIANPVVDEDMLRQMVREVVQEQLRGEIGREIIRAMKMDLIRSLEKF